MGNVIDSFFTGFFHSIGNFFGSPLGFLSGKSCSSVCPSPWDFICYIENFCVANLAKVALILILSYIFLFFIYMLYKIGFWHCIVHGFCRILWTFVSCWFYSVSYCCSFFFYDLLLSKQRRRRRNRRHEGFVHTHHDDEEYDDDEDEDDDDGSVRYERSRRERRKEERLRKTLRPNSHRVRVGVRKEDRSESGLVHGVRVSRESRFARKGSKHRTRLHYGARARGT